MPKRRFYPLSTPEGISRLPFGERDQMAELAELDTFPKLLLHHSAKRGDQPAIRLKSRGIWRTLTWRELADEAAAVAAGLAERGLQRGGHVAFLGGNRPRLYAAMCAAHGLGGIAVPLFQDAPAAEIAPILQSAEVTHIFAEDQEQVDKLLEILPRCPSVRCIVYDKDRGMRHYKQPQLVSYADLAKAGRGLLASKPGLLEAEAAHGSGNDMASLLFTSGTSGGAKGVALTHAALIDRARTAASMDGLTDSDAALAYLPPAWIGQHLFAYAQPLTVGSCICCPESAETMLLDIREIGPTYFLAPPSVLEAMVTRVSIRMQNAGAFKRGLYGVAMALARRVGGRILSGQRVFVGSRFFYGIGNVLIYGPLRDVLGLSRVRVAYTSGEAVGPDVLTFFRSVGINLKQLYGSTETGFFVAMQPDGQVKPDTVGPAAQGVELTFTPQREVLVRSPGLFRGYHRDPDATARVLTADGWFHTGDAGYLGDDGHLRIIDRVKDIGTLNDGTLYAPKLIENRIKFSPYVKEAVAFGDRRDMVCMLIDIDVEAVANWADKQSISFTGHADLASRDEVYKLIRGVITKVNSDLAPDPARAPLQIHRFLILHKELDADDGVLTRMRKLRRDAVTERYRPLVEAMYDGRDRVHFDDVPHHDDGLAVAGPIDLRISDAPTIAPAQARRVA
jgi:long-chain acyl-CoA synthetase